MPELPEVETVARQLAPHLTGRTVRSLAISDPRLRHGRTPRVRGRKIVDVGRSGKRVLIRFSPLAPGPAPARSGQAAALWLAVHLRMTGRLLWSPDGRVEERAHLRARFSLDRGALFFIDTRRFGTFDWFASEGDARPKGVDPLSSGLTPARLAELISGSRQNVKGWLLRQDRLVGLGNIYASEILYSAGVSPLREAGSLDRAELGKVLTSTRKILRRAIDNCGTTFSDFQDARGVEGSYQQFLSVYDREDERCRRCRSTILRLVQQQRSTYYCSGCQH